MGFADCALDDGVALADMLDGCDIETLPIINCGLIDDELIRALHRMERTSLRTVNLSGSRLTGGVTRVRRNNR